MGMQGNTSDLVVCGFSFTDHEDSRYLLFKIANAVTKVTSKICVGYVSISIFEISIACSFIQILKDGCV
jgi:hypothetical protein